MGCRPLPGAPPCWRRLMTLMLIRLESGCVAAVSGGSPASRARPRAFPLSFRSRYRGYSPFDEGREARHRAPSMPSMHPKDTPWHTGAVDPCPCRLDQGASVGVLSSQNAVAPAASTGWHCHGSGRPAHAGAGLHPEVIQTFQLARAADHDISNRDDTGLGTIGPVAVPTYQTTAGNASPSASGQDGGRPSSRPRIRATVSRAQASQVRWSRHQS